MEESKKFSGFKPYYIFTLILHKTTLVRKSVFLYTQQKYSKMISMICTMIFKKAWVVIYMLIYISIILLKNMFLYISKHICKLLSRYVFSKDVKHWIIKTEIAEIENDNKQHYPIFDPYRR